MAEQCEIISKDAWIYIKDVWIYIKDVLTPLIGVLIGAYLTTHHDKKTKKKEYALAKLDEYDEMIKDGIREISELPSSISECPLPETEGKKSNRRRIVRFKRFFSIKSTLPVRLLEINEAKPEFIQGFVDSVEMLKKVLTGDDFKEDNWRLPDDNKLASWRSRHAQAIDNLRIELLK